MAKSGRELCAADGPAKDSGAWRFRRRVAVLPTVIATASVQLVAPGGPIVVVAPSSAAHVVAVLRLALVVEVVVH